MLNKFNKDLSDLERQLGLLKNITPGNTEISYFVALYSNFADKVKTLLQKSDYQQAKKIETVTVRVWSVAQRFQTRTEKLVESVPGLKIDPNINELYLIKRTIEITIENKKGEINTPKKSFPYIQKGLFKDINSN